MIKTLARSVREFKKMAVLTPLLVIVEVILECIIPFTIANLVNEMQAGCGMDVIVNYGIQLVVMAVLSLVFVAVLSSVKYFSFITFNVALNACPFARDHE